MSNALIPFQEVQSMATAIAKSGLFGMKTPEQALALMLVAQAEGMHPATITQDYDVIQGKACRKTHSVMSRFQQMGGKVEWHSLDETKADATFSHPAGGSLRLTWTFEQAKKAGLTNKDNWKNYPRAMLRARCIAEGVRSIYPAAIGGMMVAEEAQDQTFNAAGDERIVTGTVVSEEQTKTEKPECLQAAFDKHMKKVAPMMQSGERTVEQIISGFAERYTLTQAQIEAIKDAATSQVIEGEVLEGEPA